MTKEDYIRQKDEIKEEKRKLDNKLLKLKCDYIDTNKKFELGDKVEITTPSYKHHWSGEIIPETKRFAYVSGFEVDFRSEVTTLFYRAKKDGQPSKIGNDYQRATEIVRLVE